MNEIVWHFTLGLLVSFLGSIPLGTVNLAVVQTTISINLRAGLYFAIGATIIELFYSALAIKLVSELMVAADLDRIIQMVAIPAFIILGMYYFRKNDSGAPAREMKRRQSFISGLVIGLANPLQIPFWVAYGSYFLSNQWIKNDDLLLDTFILGICAGTLLILSCIALVSKKIVSVISLKTSMVNKFIAGILFLLALYQSIRLSLNLLQ